MLAIVIALTGIAGAAVGYSAHRLTRPKLVPKELLRVGDLVVVDDVGVGVITDFLPHSGGDMSVFVRFNVNASSSTADVKRVRLAPIEKITPELEEIIERVAPSYRDAAYGRKS